MKQKHLLVAAGLMALSATFTACSDDDEKASAGNAAVDPVEVSFIVTSNDLTKSLRGGSRMKVFTDLNSPKTDQLVYGDSANADVAYSVDGFTQAKYNSQAGFFTGYIYRQGSVEESKGGIGSGKMGARTFTYSNGRLTQSGVNIITNFGNVGVFGNYNYAAMNSDLAVNIFSANGGLTTWQAIDLAKYAIDGTAPIISDVIDMGNNRLCLALYYSNRDSAAVAFTDYSFSKVSDVVFDSRIGGIFGAWRSVRYAIGGAADDGTAYVFCGTNANGDKLGALRIKSGASTFDPSYRFDLNAAAGGYRFRKAYPISGSKFLLEFYVDKAAYGVMDTSGKFAIADMESKTLTWVTGLPAESQMSGYSVGYGDGYDGYYYLPFSPSEPSSSGGGGRPGRGVMRASSNAVPTIYKINAETGAASVFMTFSKNESVKAINIIKK